MENEIKKGRTPVDVGQGDGFRKNGSMFGRLYSQVVICKRCNGTGEVLMDGDIDSRKNGITACDTCDGAGKLIRDTDVNFFKFKARKYGKQ